MAKTKKKTRTTRKATRKTTKKTARRAPKISPAPKDKPRTKGQVFRDIAEQTDLTRKQVSDVFETLGVMMEKDLKNGPGVFNLGGLMKVTLKRKPARPARKGINPFTGEETTFKAKPAENQVKVRPLKALKDRVNPKRK